jgi:translocator protein
VAGNPGGACLGRLQAAAAFGLWTLNIVAIGGWSALFFGGKKLGASAAAAGGMLATGAAFTAVAAKVDRKAAATGVPFVAWLAFATVLAEEVWRRNRKSGTPAQGRGDGFE